MSMPFTYLLVFTIFIVQCQLSIGGFEPYADNGGTVVGIAGKDYCLIAADTRMSEQYFIRSRKLSRIFTIDNGLLLSGSGCWSDILSLSKELQSQAKMYEYEHDRKLTIRPLSYLVSSQLYMRRFFPYFTFCMIAGIDQGGKGNINRYDAVGSSERVAAVCCGKGEHLIQPILDELTGMEEDPSLWEQALDGENAFISTSMLSRPLHKLAAIETGVEELATSSLNIADTNLHQNQQQQDGRGLCVDISAEQATEVVLRAFKAAAEREISVGDGIEVWVLRKSNRMSELLGGDLKAKRNEEYEIKKTFHPLPQH